MRKDYLKIKGIVTQVGELVHIQRTGIPDLYKRVLTIETSDEQVLYPELRNSKLKLLESQNIEEQSIVEIEFSFEGSEKNDKRYNNIYINNITKL